MARLAKWSRRSSSNRMLTKRSANRTYAKRKLQWIAPYNSECNLFLTAPLTECPNGGVISLLTNADIRSQFEDAVRVVRIKGQVHFQPTMPVDSSCEQILGQWATDPVILRLGLKKSQVNMASGVPDAINPLQTGATAFDRGGFPDGKWLKLWEHMWFPAGWVSNENAPLTCCPVVTSPGSINPLVAGTGTVTIPAIVTECITCNIEEQPTICNYGAETHKGWTLNLDYKKPLRLTEADSLDLWFGFERLNMSGVPPRPSQPYMTHCGGIRLLVEK